MMRRLGFVGLLQDLKVSGFYQFIDIIGPRQIDLLDLLSLQDY